MWRYLTEQAYRDNTLPRSLSVKKIMDTWTLQMGFPVLTVERDYNSNSATLYQDRFLIAKSENNPDKHDYMWWIPVTYVEAGGDFSNTYNKIWMSDTEKRKRIDVDANKNKAVVFNVQQSGYYRVNYDKRNWELLIKQLNDDHQSIHVINRAQIIDDALNLARAGLLDYKIALGVTSYLNKETEYIPWGAALNGMSYINKMLRRSPAYGAYRKYMRALIDPLYKRVGFENRPGDQPLDVFLRKLAVSWACSLGNMDCIDMVKSEFKVWMDTIQPDEENANK